MAKDRIRLDQLLVQRGLAETRSKAQALIMAGEVRVGGKAQVRAGDMVAPDVVVELSNPLPYVSRGGYKLAHALEAFGLTPAGCVVLDVGASTGGFTDVLLQHGAQRVYAVDVGYGILDWRLRSDPRVVVIERTNIRYLEALPVADDEAPQLADCATIDVSFISLALVLPAVQRLIKPHGWIVALIKPQFEAGAEHVGKGGVVRDAAVHAAVLRTTLLRAQAIGLMPHGLVRSPITGPAGNVEFLVWLGGDGPTLDNEAAITQALERRE
ncbi:MAG TPA: TlyA family RNA methyltransferase [Roseiflexaceae bacterium]|nr:TlyA family RNA methyltransferase [Roseiflexaceae bacterium]HMP42223.1 TlyA family RNA methyltransferase [Roseiflexaceae bacterium]